MNNADLLFKFFNKFLKCFVLREDIFGSLKILSCLLFALTDKACFNPSRLTFLFNFLNADLPLCLGPCATPPPTNIGAVILPCLAPPEPFCCTIFLLEPFYFTSTFCMSCFFKHSIFLPI